MPSGLCVGVLAMLAWLACVRWLVCVSCLLDQSQLKIFDRGGYEPTWPAPYNTTVTLKILKFSNFFHIVSG